MFKISISDLYQLSKKTDILKSNIKVLTPLGFKKVYGVDITNRDSEMIKLVVDGELELTCSPDHQIKSSGIWTKAKDFIIDNTIDTRWGSKRILDIQRLDGKKDLLDLHVDGNEYYTNDILSHNSSLIESFEYTLYGKVKSNKAKKWYKLSTLPNRINGELLNSIKFQSGGTDVLVKRGISPNKLELWENGVLNERAGKANIDSSIEKYVGMDIETFKSFISLSINDFKNFISLSNEEKQLLLDKLFNLEVINILGSILKDINKSNKNRMLSLDSEIRTLEESIDSIRRSINKAVERQKEAQRVKLESDIKDRETEILEIKEFINSKKEEYTSLKEKMEKIKNKEEEIKSELDNEKRQMIITESDIKSINREIELYDSGKCPTCSTDFNSPDFITLKQTLIEKRDSYLSILEEIKENIENIKPKSLKIKEIWKKTEESFNDLTWLMRTKKSELEKLNNKIQEEKSKIETISVSELPDIEEFQKTMEDLIQKKSISGDYLDQCREKESYYKEINKILGEDGVKKSIISSIIKPINHFIDKNIRDMRLPFIVRLDETFTADIQVLSNSVDHDSLSTGETKLVNIAILIAYLKLIRTKKNINILFLDEVFSSIDINNIDRILSLLKEFSNEYKINIFVVHHAVLNQEMFDRILHIEKNVFSEIRELDFDF